MRDGVAAGGLEGFGRWMRYHAMSRFLTVFASLCLSATAAFSKPNIIIIYADDLGYGDLGCYGHPTIRTPNLDRMAAEGMRFTEFYSAAEVCTPSRAALLTGRYPVRSGMASRKKRVLFPNSLGGLPQSEITIAKGLKGAGYATACVGKWHLGHLPEFLPTKHGFDSYFGIPYSNDMDRDASVGPKGRDAFWEPKVEYWKPPLMRNEEVIERGPDQRVITKNYTEEAVKFIREKKEEPFFLYLAHSMPHVPLFASEAFLGKSPRGLYGDVVEEVDWSVGQVLDTLKELGIAENTVVFFSSDNGPWLTFNEQGGSAGLLREGKGSTWEGGMREPGIAWWPGKIKPGICREMAVTMDLFTTSLLLGEAEVPTDRVIDGKDIRPLLFGTGTVDRGPFIYYRGDELYAARIGRHKAHYITKSSYGKDPAEAHNPPLLFDIGIDPGESWDIAAKHPKVLKEIQAAVDAHRATVKPVVNQLELVAE